MRRRRRESNGNILAITMIILLLAAVVAAGLASLSNFHNRLAARDEVYKDEFEIAEAVLAKGYAEIRFLIENARQALDAATLASIEAPAFDKYSIEAFSINETSSGTEIGTGGAWAGLSIQVAKYRIAAQVHKEGGTSERFEHPGVSLRQDLELRLVPLQVFGIFYYGDLEFSPSPAMTVDGRVHTNGNMYITAETGLNFKERVSAVGQILHGTHPDSGLSNSTGDVKFWDGAADVSMQPGEDGWLDHPDSDWATASEARWNGYVADESHNVMDLPLPIAKNEEPHAIIERANPSDPDSLKREKFENKAGLKILRNPVSGEVEGFDSAGNTVSLTYDDAGTPDTIYSESTYYDQREQIWVQSLDIDIEKLIASGIAPTNGILYVSNEGDDGVVRVKNASKLPNTGANGFTVASDDAMYVHGDFNTVNKIPALIAGDAVMIQSNKWDDSKSNSSDMAVRKAEETTMNAVVFQGIVPTQTVMEGADEVNHYSGGVENYFRLMENWTGVNFNFNGSLICMWNSERWDGWFRGWPVSRPPDRNWSWDTSLGTAGPPGIPLVYEVRRRHWQIRDLAGI